MQVEQSTYTFKVSAKSKQINYGVLCIYIYIFRQISTYMLTRYFINKMVSFHVTAHNNIYFNVCRNPPFLKSTSSFITLPSPTQIDRPRNVCIHGIWSLDMLSNRHRYGWWCAETYYYFKTVKFDNRRKKAYVPVHLILYNIRL